jgi:hypothetical protein
VEDILHRLRAVVAAVGERDRLPGLRQEIGAGETAGRGSGVAASTVGVEAGAGDSAGVPAAGVTPMGRLQARAARMSGTSGSRTRGVFTGLLFRGEG